ncbi:PRC-barrel domain-containing protein [Paenibacillus ginsengarvi]|uniref:Photosystem reaction center subunit H n=1 Tax=Paenibacillus ginsengarvi TaxID=400777 RepID=A0A3B0C7J3_9BACL|nr:PRC-barrel domain-containing protein [Paenibacillus ginsengarvi]RKN80419.1 photosystem reaction center subunit H [Paenibacillus ginsengarvi]
MRKAGDIMGLPVLILATGKQAGIAKDFLIDRDWKLRGILIEAKGWFAASRYIEWDDIEAIGADAVTIKDEQAVRDLGEETADLVPLLDGSFKLKGLPVVTASGDELGFVEDVYFGTQMDKKILGYELSGGLISDLTEGRRWLPLPEEATIGEDAVIVPVHCDLKDAPSIEEIG